MVTAVTGQYTPLCKKLLNGSDHNEVMYESSSDYLCAIRVISFVFSMIRSVSNMALYSALPCGFHWNFPTYLILHWSHLHQKSFRETFQVREKIPIFLFCGAIIANVDVNNHPLFAFHIHPLPCPSQSYQGRRALCHASPVACPWWVFQVGFGCVTRIRDLFCFSLLEWQFVKVVAKPIQLASSLPCASVVPTLYSLVLAWACPPYFVSFACQLFLSPFHLFYLSFSSFLLWILKWTSQRHRLCCCCAVPATIQT